MEVKVNNIDLLELFGRLKDYGLSDTALNSIFGIEIDSNTTSKEQIKEILSQNFHKISYFISCLDSLNTIPNHERLISVIKMLETDYSLPISFLAKLSQIEEQYVTDFMNNKAIDDKYLFNLTMAVMFINSMIIQVKYI